MVGTKVWNFSFELVPCEGSSFVWARPFDVGEEGGSFESV